MKSRYARIKNALNSVPKNFQRDGGFFRHRKI